MQLIRVAARAAVGFTLTFVGLAGVAAAPAGATVPQGTISVVRSSGPAGFWTPFSASACPKPTATQSLFYHWHYEVQTSDGATQTGVGLGSVDNADRTWSGRISLIPEPAYAGHPVFVHAQCEVLPKSNPNASPRITQTYPTFKLTQTAPHAPGLTPTTIHPGTTVTLTDGGGCGAYAQTMTQNVQISTAHFVRDSSTSGHWVYTNYPTATRAVSAAGRWSAVSFKVPSTTPVGDWVVMSPRCSAADGSGVEQHVAEAQLS